MSEAVRRRLTREEVIKLSAPGRSNSHFQMAIGNLAVHLNNSERVRQSLIDAGINPVQLENWINECLSDAKCETFYRPVAG